MSSRGLFITLEGGEGAGKSSTADALAQRIHARGLTVVHTREPGGTPLGERLRDVLLDLGEGNIALDPLSETLLFMAARAELVANVIAPALDCGAIVLCDRFADSTRAYQGFGRGGDLDAIEQLNAVATRGLRTDLTILLDLPPAGGLARASAPADRFGREDASFHERVREGYRTLAAREPDRWLVIDATQPAEAVLDAVWQRVETLLPSQG